MRAAILGSVILLSGCSYQTYQGQCNPQYQQCYQPAPYSTSFFFWVHPSYWAYSWGHPYYHSVSVVHVHHYSYVPRGTYSYRSRSSYVYRPNKSFSTYRSYSRSYRSFRR